jgi:hypothetical protein
VKIWSSWLQEGIRVTIEASNWDKNDLVGEFSSYDELNRRSYFSSNIFDKRNLCQLILYLHFSNLGHKHAKQW